MGGNVAVIDGLAEGDAEGSSVGLLLGLLLGDEARYALGDSVSPSFVGAAVLVDAKNGVADRLEEGDAEGGSGFTGGTSPVASFEGG